MITKKANWVIYFMMALFSAIFAGGVYAIYLLLSGSITDETNEVIGGISAYLMSLALGVVLISYALSVICLAVHAVRNKGVSFVADSEGIHCTFIYLNLLAFLFCGRIRHIPWNAVKNAEENQGALVLTVNTKAVDASFVAKLLLKIQGYTFCHGCIKPKLDEREKAVIMSYITKASD